jgi:hypothetical protein
MVVVVVDVVVVVRGRERSERGWQGWCRSRSPRRGTVAVADEITPATAPATSTATTLCGYRGIRVPRKRWQSL